MLFHLLFPLSDDLSVFNVVRYITFRTAAASITSVILCFALAPFFLRWLHKYNIGETIREDGPERHHSKAGTPTMGGFLILLTILVSTLLWADWQNKYIWLILVSTFGFGVIGFLDDFLKIRYKNGGLRGRHKLLAQTVLSVFLALVLYLVISDGASSTQLSVPFFKNFLPDLRWFYFVLGVIVIVGASNAANLTDGLDGLALGPTIVATVAYTIIAYVVGHAKFAEYLQVVHVRGAGELSVFGGAMIGACLAFLWYNAYPAQVFMGNVGSLSLGGALGTMAVATRHELLLLLVGGIFVIEALSVMLQVASFKMTGKRLFRMAPLHHHFEQKGWPEPKVIVRFWIISIILALLSLGTLKLR